ncbi:MAG: hypothetical protein QIT33_gp01 [Methanophagales virus PBV300]|uniref:Antitoxin VbhA domain-containing protein n=1 Tax=Methanophagales virus PBV300 TaxID=2987731 RepID=A0ABY6GM19_9VIRU|nr:MAG: hypothetical protein QIT33_gp01 [Methanophagales virus PBV300]UYL64963.1 MAG: hypothetical protein JBCDKDKM_00001 [Methanophagales virus PBV300]
MGEEREGLKEKAEEKERKYLLWRLRNLRAAKQRKMERLQRECGEVAVEWQRISEITYKFERGEISAEEVKRLLGEKGEYAEK